MNFHSSPARPAIHVLQYGDHLQVAALHVFDHGRVRGLAGGKLGPAPLDSRTPTIPRLAEQANALAARIRPTGTKDSRPRGEIGVRGGVKNAPLETVRMKGLFFP